MDNEPLNLVDLFAVSIALVAYTATVKARLIESRIREKKDWRRDEYFLNYIKALAVGDITLILASFCFGYSLLLKKYSDLRLFPLTDILKVTPQDFYAEIGFMCFLLGIIWLASLHVYEWGVTFSTKDINNRKANLSIDEETKPDDTWRLAQAIVNYKIIGRELRKANLIKADLKEANLIKADLREADLREADLRGADLRRADLRGANLRGADLRGADLRGADLRETNLKGANLRGADLRGTNLSRTDLKNVQIDRATVIDDRWSKVWEIVNRGTANVILIGADLSEADLRGSNLRRTNLSGADLRGTNLIGANLSGANLSGANLSGADLKNVQIDRTTVIDDRWGLVWDIVNQGTAYLRLTNANLSGANLSGADLRGTNLSGADLRGADLRGADLSKAVLDRAKINEDTSINEETKLDGKWRLNRETVNERIGLPLKKANLRGLDMLTPDSLRMNLIYFLCTLLVGVGIYFCSLLIFNINLHLFYLFIIIAHLIFFGIMFDHPINKNDTSSKNINQTRRNFLWIILLWLSIYFISLFMYSRESFFLSLGEFLFFYSFFFFKQRDV